MIKKTRSLKWLVISILVVMLSNVGFCATFSLSNLFDFGSNENIDILNRLNATWSLPKEYSLEVIDLNGIQMEWVQEKNVTPDKVILQLHGGAYNRSLKDNGLTYRRAAVQYAKLSGARVLTVDYRVAPENPYPAALEDALAAYTWLLNHGYKAEQIVIAGDSAGGGLTLATVLYLRDHDLPLPAGLITMSAWTNLNYRLRLPPYVGNNRADDPYISPIYGDFTGFPPMLMQVGGDEMLLNDTLKVATIAKETGVTVQLTEYEGMFHVFQMLFPELSLANEAWDEIAAFLNDIF